MLILFTCIRYVNIKKSSSITTINDFVNVYKISNRELDVILLLNNDKSYNEIADNLFISYQTVKTHIRNIYKKTNVNSKRNLKLKLITCLTNHVNEPEI